MTVYAIQQILAFIRDQLLHILQFNWRFFFQHTPGAGQESCGLLADCELLFSSLGHARLVQDPSRQQRMRHRIHSGRGDARPGSAQGEELKADPTLQR